MQQLTFCRHIVCGDYKVVVVLLVGHAVNEIDALW